MLRTNVITGSRQCLHLDLFSAPSTIRWKYSPLRGSVQGNVRRHYRGVNCMLVCSIGVQECP